MKNSKKLLILVLSLMLLVGVFVTAASAESADKVTVLYPDGTEVQYAVGETIVAPEGDLYAGKDNTLFKNAGAGWAYSLDGAALSDLTVTEAMLGKTVTASGYDKVYFAVEVTDGETIYYTDANTAGANFKSYMQNMDAAGSTTVLYEDITSEGIAIIGKKESTYRLDLNGHTLTNTTNAGGGAFDVRQNEFYLYSSKEGGVWDTSKVAYAFRTNDGTYGGIRIDGDFHIGEYNDTRTDYGKNLTVYAQCLNSDMYGASAYFNGGTYVQTAGSSAGYFLMIGRKASNESHVQKISNCTFVITQPTTGVVWHFTSAARTYTNCNFINESGSAVQLFANETMNAANTMKDCSFYDVYTPSVQGGKAINYSAGCYYAFSGALPERADGEFYAHGASKTLEVNGETYVLDGMFINNTSEVAAINWGGIYTDYWVLGATPYCNLSALNFIVENANGTATFYGDATVDASVFVPITEDMLGSRIDAAVEHNTIAPIAFSWKTGSVTSQVLLTEGMTAEEVGQAFYDTFAELDFAADIKLYTSLIIPAAMGWGPSFEEGLNTQNNMIITYSSLKGGNVTLDLNGFVLSIPDLTEGINLSNSNHTGSYPHSSTVIFGFEGTAGRTFTLKSSRPGAQILNASSLALFGVGEQDVSHIVIDGANITYVGKGAVTHAIEVSGSTLPTLTVNGGTYVIESNLPAFSFQSVVTVKDAKIILLGDAPLAVFATHNWKRNGSFTVENTVFYSKNATKLLAFIGSAYGESTPADASKNYVLTLKDCSFAGVSLEKNEHLDTFEISGIIKADTEAALLAAYGTQPAGTVVAKYVVDLNGDIVTFLGFGKASEIVTVNYAGIVPTEYYLLGSVFTPVNPKILKDTYYKLNAGVFVDIEGYKSNMASAHVTEAMLGKTYDAAAYINYVEKPVSFVVLVADAPVAHGLLASETVGADLIAAVKAAEAGAVIRLYADITASVAIENAAAVTLELNGKTLYVSSAFVQNAALSLKDGAVVLSENVAALFGGAVTLENVALYNVAAKTALTAATATVTDSKVYNLTLGSAVLNGTVFHTDEGLSDSAIYNNNLEVITLGDASYDIVFTRAATDDESLLVNATFTYKGEVKDVVTYFVGSIPVYYASAVEGYYYSYSTTEPIVEDAEFACIFVADASKLKAQFVVTDALNVIFYLQKDGVDAITLSGTALDIAALEVVTFVGSDVEYYAIPVLFNTFADSLKVVDLAVDINLGESVETVSARISLLDYVEQILEGEAYAEKDKTLVYALLAYVDSIVDYFKYDVESDIKLVLSAYAEYATAYAAPEAEKISSDYVHGVLYVVDEKVSLALRVDPAFEGEIAVGGVVFTAEDITLIDGNAYFILKDLSFSEITQDYVVEITIADAVVETFTYSFATYTDAMTVQNMGYVPTYVKALYTFATLAAAYVA